MVVVVVVIICDVRFGSVVCVLLESDVSRGSYNMHQVQCAFAHAFYTLCNAVNNDSRRRPHDTGNPAEGSATATRHGDPSLCTDSILSCITQMPHQHLHSSSQHDSNRTSNLRRKKAFSSSQYTMSSRKKDKFCNNNITR